MRRTLVVIFLLAILAACGSATEVGNPTGEIPRTITGVIDTTGVLDLSATTSLANTAAISGSALTVVALATDGTSAESPVASDDSFSLEVAVGKTYTLSVRLETQTIGTFSFEENDQGARSQDLTISETGEPIALGTCRYEDGAFVPEHEPRRYRGVNAGGSGNGPQSGSLSAPKW